MGSKLKILTVVSLGLVAGATALARVNSSASTAAVAFDPFLGARDSSSVVVVDQPVVDAPPPVRPPFRPPVRSPFRP